VRGKERKAETEKGSGEKDGGGQEAVGRD